MIDVLLGLQWGDEGKGKIVDYLAEKYDIIARFQGGPNAGHTLFVGGTKIVLHTIPSGVFQPHCMNLIGNGVVIDPIILKQEIAKILPYCPDLLERLIISHRAHLILPTHRALDAASEQMKGNEKIGSTLKGIGPAYMDKTGRNGLRVGDIISGNFKEKYEKLKQKHLQLLKQYAQPIEWEHWEEPFLESVNYLSSLQIKNAEYWLNEQLEAGKKVLAEGAQGSMLDIDFGTYPYVTSSSTTAAGVCNGLGVAPSKIGEVYGITKAYCTRVGSGPFPTELDDVYGQKLRDAGKEYGATTGRPRRCGWIDLVALKYVIMLSGVTKLILTKADVLDNFTEIKVAGSYLIDGMEKLEMPFNIDEVNVLPIYKSFKGWEKSLSLCRSFEELPTAFKDYCNFVENYLGINFVFISNGVERKHIIELPCYNEHKNK